MKPIKLLKRSDAKGAPFYARFKVRKKAYLWSTKTDDISLARKRAQNYRAAVIADKFSLVDRMNTVSTVATFDQLIAAYLALLTPAPKTRAVNVSAMRAIMAANNLIGSDRLDRLDAQCVTRFQHKSLAAAGGGESAMVTCNSRVRCARSMFSKRALYCYGAELKIPEETVKAFFRVPALRESEPRRELPTAEADAKAHAELPAHPEHYRAYLLARYGGLRAGEIVAARRDWLDGEKLYIGGKTDEFNTKSRRWRVVALPPRVAELLTLSDDPVFLVGPNRVRTVRVGLPAYLKDMGFPKTKPLHSIRRQFGSEVYTQFGPRQARDALGHSTQQITDRHYCRSLDAPKALAFAG
ncbi:MAG TPA: hypothetical protein VGD88_09660 [Opitutaceae bacterium]